LGYQVVAELVNEGLKTDTPIAEVALKYELMSGEELAEILDPANVCAPALINVQLRDDIQKRQPYLNYRDLIGK
jgi:aspartate ammonia-lyase